MVVKSDKFYLNDIPYKSNKAIIVTSYDGHLMFLKETLKRYMKTGAYVICAYDRHNIPPPADVMDIPHAWVFKHKTYGAEKRLGWLWNIIYGGNLVSQFSNFKYIITVNSDCIWERPRGIDSLTKLVEGRYDLSSSSSNGTIHTCAVIYKEQAFKKFLTYIKNQLEINVPEGYSPEVLLRDFVRDYLFNRVPPLQARYPEGHIYAGQVDHYSSYNQDSTWKRIVGYRNLGGEHKWSCLEHLEPVLQTYCDLRTDEHGAMYLSQHEQNLFNYYLSMDRRWLYKYWAEGEDSYYNRIYMPLEYYGDEPLHDDSKRKEFGPPSERWGFFNRFGLDFDMREIIKEKGYGNN